MDPDGLVTQPGQAGDRVGDLGAGRVEHGDEAEEGEVAFGVFAPCGWIVAGQGAVGDGEEPQAVAGHVEGPDCRLHRGIPAAAAGYAVRTR
ncbi:hypothetical protein [Dactylosporangium sp. NPDC050588]|uniref:hypothetical protein n=1 Tax=Dactylosporangium sp. NPDC050588 TaxID=3157211 RepID=UPI0033F06DD7